MTTEPRLLAPSIEPAMTSTSASKSAAAAEAAFLSALSGWKMANQELDSLAEQITSEQSRIDELTLLADELSRLEPAAVMHRMVGPVLTPLSVSQATSETESKLRRLRNETARLTKRQQQLSLEQKQRRQQLQSMQQHMPQMPDAIYDL